MGDESNTGPVDAALIERWALAYLERFASSAENLRRVLRRRIRRRGLEAGKGGEAAAAIDALVARFRTAGMLDDVAYAAARARARLRRGQALRTIRAGLAQKGVAAADVEAALRSLDEAAGDADGGLDLAAACAFARRRRLGPYRRDAADPAREFAAFARAGFSRRHAEAVLACADEAGVAELLKGAELE
jgi:regulatory protein